MYLRLLCEFRVIWRSEMRTQYFKGSEFLSLTFFGKVFEISSESGATKTCQSRSMFPAESRPLPWNSLQVLFQPSVSAAEFTN